MTERPAGARPAAEWREIEAHLTPDATGSALIGLVVGGVVVVLLVWRDRLVLAAVLALVVAVLTAARHLSPRVDRVVAQVLVRVGHLVGVVLAWVLLVPITIFVITPVWLLLGLLRWDPMAPEPRHRGRWNEHLPGPAARFVSRLYTDERDHRRSGVTVGRGLAAGGLVCLFFGALALGLYSAYGLLTTPGQPPVQLARNGLSPEFEQAPWAAELTHDFGISTPVYDSILTWRTPAEIRSRYVNIDDHARRSYQADLPDDRKPLEVWFFGSSALFGAFQRQDHTIVSDVVRLAEQDGIPVAASNFGVIAYSNWQETMLMALLLTERPPPDLIVFYDGMNDFTLYQDVDAPTEPAQQFGDEIEAVLQENHAALAFPVQPGSAETGARGTPENAARLYNEGVELSHRIAGAYGVEVLHYFQPSIYSLDTPVDPRVLRVIQQTEESVDTESRRWDRGRALLDPRVTDLGAVFDGVEGTIYYDSVHHDEAGAELVAEALYDTLRPRLQQLP
jgi:lysophospholipase L1-like esterase